jgi:hypothetical protein
MAKFCPTKKGTAFLVNIHLLTVKVYTEDQIAENEEIDQSNVGRQFRLVKNVFSGLLVRGQISFLSNFCTTIVCPSEMIVDPLWPN